MAVMWCIPDISFLEFITFVSTPSSFFICFSSYIESPINIENIQSMVSCDRSDFFNFVILYSKSMRIKLL